MAEQPIIVKKKVVKGHGHHGGSWKVAYADFVTSMMAFFMVMWLMNMSQADKDQIQGYFQDPLGFASTTPKSRTLLTMQGMPKPKPGAGKESGSAPVSASQAEQSTLEQVKRKILKKLEGKSEFAGLSKNIKMSITEEGLLIEFIETQGAVFFESGSAEIRPEALKLIQEIAPILAKANHPMQLQGHTDTKPFGGVVNGNWALSTQRATSLLVALESAHVPDGEIQGVDGLADRKLLDVKNPTSFSNRRVTILLPREYSNANTSATPADLLHSAVNQATEPQAVMLKPGKADLSSKTP